MSRTAIRDFKSNSMDSWIMNSTTPGIPKKIQELKTSLATFFTNMTIEVDETIAKEEYLLRGVLCSNQSTCECFCLKIVMNPFVVWIERIKFKYGEQCNLTGTEILQKLTNCFRELQLPKVVLFDVAKVQFEYNGESIQISMHIFNILLYGQSWYNRFGYVSDKYEEEKAHNAVLQNTKISSQLLAKLKKEVPNCNVKLLDGSTFKQIGEIVNTELRSNRNICVLKLMQKLQIYLEKNKKVKYDFYLEQSFSKKSKTATM